MNDREEHVNPFASPTADDGAYRPPLAGNAAPVEDVIRPCPKCDSTGAKPAPYDWWRGRRGPKAIDHVICPDCECQYHGETGVAYPPAKSPMPWFIAALSLFILYVVVYSMLVVGGF